MNIDMSDDDLEKVIVMFKAMLRELQDLSLAANNVVECWEGGDLAAAVRQLSDAVVEARGTIVSAEMMDVEEDDDEREDQA